MLCKPTSEIKTFDPKVKQKILNDEKVPVYATFLRSIINLNCPLSVSWLISEGLDGGSGIHYSLKI